MMFSHDDSDRVSWIRIGRDSVEILAIVAAGIWAFYVFAYENRIKPSLGNPEVAFSATMSKVSEHNGMIGIQLNTEMRNVGSVKAHFLGYVIWVSGRKFDPQTTFGSRRQRRTYCHLTERSIASLAERQSMVTGISRISRIQRRPQTCCSSRATMKKTKTCSTYPRASLICSRPIC